MNKTVSFVRLDLLTLKPYGRSLLFLVSIGIVMGIAFHSISILSSIFMVGLILVMSYPFAISEKNGTERFYATLSLRRRDVVVGRYLFVVLTQLAGVLLILLLSIVVSDLIGTPMNMQELLLSLCILSFVVSFTVSIQYPLFFKLGYSKAKAFVYLPLILVSMLVGMLPSLSKEIPELSMDALLKTINLDPVLLYAAPVLLGLVMLVISCSISCRVYEIRDL